MTKTSTLTVLETNQAIPDIWVDLLEMLASQRVVTVNQAHRFIGAPAGFRTKRTVQKHLQGMYNDGLVHRVTNRSGRELRYLLTQKGVESVMYPERAFQVTTQTAAGAQGPHLEAVVELGSLMAMSAAEWPDDECTHYDYRHEVELASGREKAVRADAVLTYTERSNSGKRVNVHTRIVELDRGTEPISTLLEKVAGYVGWASYEPAIRPGNNDRHLSPLQWQRDFPGLVRPPRLCFVFSNVGVREAHSRMERVATFMEERDWKNRLCIEGLYLPRLVQASVEPRWGPFCSGTTRTLNGESVSFLRSPRSEMRQL